MDWIIWWAGMLFVGLVGYFLGWRHCFYVNIKPVSSDLELLQKRWSATQNENEKLHQRNIALHKQLNSFAGKYRHYRSLWARASEKFIERHNAENNLDTICAPCMKMVLEALHSVPQEYEED